MRTLILAAVLAAVPGMALAQQTKGATFPVKPVRMIIPYAPGGATDIVARQVAHQLNEAWGQPIVVDNRSGASGNIALEVAARSIPDGYTLFVGNVSTNAINETTFAEVLRVKPSKDLTGVTNLVEIPHILAAGANVPVTTVRQLIDYAKQPASKLNYASAGIGTYPHLDMVMFLKAAGINANHVPYKAGAGGMVPSVLGGETQLMFVNLASTVEHVRNNRMKALATAAPNRLPELPNVPTMKEAGFPGIGTNAWNGMFAPAGTPRAIVHQIHAKVTELMERPALKAQLAKTMMAVSLSATPEAYTAFVRTETEKWAKVVRENNIRIE